MLESIVTSPTVDAETREMAVRTMVTSARLRGQRDIIAQLVVPSSQFAAVANLTANNLVHTANNTTALPGRLVRSEANKTSADIDVNRAYDGADATYQLLRDDFKRKSIDDRNMTLSSTVHFNKNYTNAFWDGRQMVYGDGDKRFFNSFTSAVDVIGHEFSHGVIQYTANLLYQDQSGALNESYADCFGIMVKQRLLKQTAKQSDWLIGSGLFTSAVRGKALRSLAEPGSAYNDPVLGKDPQPGHMKHFVVTTEDNGGVHVNSGIPNRAFYLACQTIGGYSWQKTGQIWYHALASTLRPAATFADAAKATAASAKVLFSNNSTEHKAIMKAWADVGIKVK